MKRLSLAVASCVALAAFVPGAASAAELPAPTVPPTGKTAVIKMVLGKKGLAFSGPKTVTQGAEESSAPQARRGSVRPRRTRSPRAGSPAVT